MFDTTPSWTRRAILLLAALPFVALLQGCDEEIVVRQSTRVYADGSLDRVVRIYGRTASGQPAPSPDWLEGAVGVTLPSEDLWDRVWSEGDGSLFAEGAFVDAADVPVGLGHRADYGVFVDGGSLDLSVADLGVLTLWSYREVLSDPFDEQSLVRAVEELVAYLSERLSEELVEFAGSGVDTGPAERFFQGELRLLATDLLTGMKRLTAESAAAGRQALFVEETLARYGIVAGPGLEEAEEWTGVLERVTDPVLSWARERVAGSLADSGLEIEGDELAFWPDAESLGELEIDLEGTGGDEMSRLLAELMLAMEGYYGGFASPEFRFESYVEMPGELLLTDGAPGGGGALWLFRGVDMRGGRLELNARSYELDEESLRAAGARRAFEPVEILRLVDILTARDPDGVLASRLDRAVDEGDLRLLADPNGEDDEIERRARELAELLDPDVDAWPDER